MTKAILRMCALSHTIKPRNEMFRIVKCHGQVLIDLDQNIKGRGAYLSEDKEIITSARKKHVLSKVLRTNVDENIYDQLLKLL